MERKKGKWRNGEQGTVKYGGLETIGTTEGDGSLLVPSPNQISAHRVGSILGHDMTFQDNIIRILLRPKCSEGSRPSPSRGGMGIDVWVAAWIVRWKRDAKPRGFFLLTVNCMEQRSTTPRSLHPRSCLVSSHFACFALLGVAGLAQSELSHKAPRAAS